jgi:peptide deformylase
MFLKIDRPYSILAEFTDEYGQVKQQRLEGMTARCYLHELDHMNGVRFVEHVGEASVQVAKRKAEKFIKTFVRAKKAIK